MSIWPVWENNNILWSLGKGCKNFYELDLEVKNAVSIKGTSYMRSRPARKERNKLESSAAKLYCLHLQEPESKRENGETPSLLRRIILRLGRITPWLAAAHRPSCRHGEGRAHGVENYPWHMHRLFVYHLEHRMSAPSCNGECEGGSPHTHTLKQTLLIPFYLYFHLFFNSDIFEVNDVKYTFTSLKLLVLQ
jgi:hypothetical protein